MNRYPDYDAPSSATDWVMNTVRRNPEGLLLFAAGCALLMRSGASPLARKFSEESHGHNGNGGRPGVARPSSLREGIARTAEDAAHYVSDVKDRVAETASSYASTVSDFADETRRNISDQSARLTRQAQSSLQTGMERMLREQPLAVAMLGVAAGAAVAAVFPVTDVENQALGTTRDALADAASRAGESLAGAAGAAGDRLKSVVAEHGLNTEGLKEMARDVAGSFATAVSGKPDEDKTSTSGATRIAAQPGSGSSASTTPKPGAQPGAQSGSQPGQHTGQQSSQQNNEPGQRTGQQNSQPGTGNMAPKTPAGGTRGSR
jgi:hypothetical protein